MVKIIETSTIYFKNGETMVIPNEKVIELWKEYQVNRSHVFFWNWDNNMGDAKDFDYMIKLSEISHIINNR